MAAVAGKGGGLIEFLRHKAGLTYRQTWFARRPTGSPWGLALHRQYLGEPLKFPWVAEEFHTILIDLQQDDEALLAGMSKNMRSQLRKAEPGLMLELETKPDDFLSFYNAFARGKGLKELSASDLDKPAGTLALYRVSLEGKVLTQHAYLLDQQESRARFLYGGSARLEEGVDTSLLGRANRWAHWQELRTFREQGIKTFDFGGYAWQTTDPAKQGINQFKEAFGGSVVQENTYNSLLLAAVKALKRR